MVLNHNELSYFYTKNQVILKFELQIFL